MTAKKIILCLCVLLTLTLLACSCGGDAEEPNDSSEEAVTHTVTFDSQGGTPVPSVQVRHGTSVSEPSVPTRENSIFEGWYYGNVKWSFFRSIEQDVTLVARWTDSGSLFEYEINSQTNEATILGIQGSLAVDQLIIPSTIKGFPVTAIGERAFEDAPATLTKGITLPSSIKAVGDYAFSGCEDIPIDTSAATFTQIGEFAFADCNLLSSISLGEGMTELPAYAFMNCEALIFVYLPSTVTRIDESAFDGCKNLSAVLIPSAVEEIGHGAFNKCESLSSLFFGGTREQFDLLLTHTHSNFNAPLFDLAEEVFLYSADEPAEKGNYWRYDETHTPKLW